MHWCYEVLLVIEMEQGQSGWKIFKAGTIFFISNSIQLVHCTYIEEEEWRCILCGPSATVWWLVGWRQLHSVECDHRKQMEAKELKWGESRVNKLVQAGLCFFTKVNHEILAGTKMLLSFRKLISCWLVTVKFSAMYRVTPKMSDFLFHMCFGFRISSQFHWETQIITFH